MRSDELTVSETADRLEVSRSTVLRMIDDDELDARRRTKKGPWYISIESIEEYEDDLDRDGDHDDEDDLDEEIEQAHEDAYREGLAECDLDGDDPDDDDEEDDYDD